MQVSRERLHALPKAELHVHLDGSLRPETMLDIARQQRMTLPASDPETLRDFMLVRDAANLVDYLSRFETTLALMQTADALQRIAFELAEDAAAENIRYLEVRFCPLLNTRGGLSTHQVLENVLAGLEEASARHHVRSTVIVCALRHMDPADSLALARLAVDFRHHGVVAFDLAGPEDGNPPADHIDAFHFAANANLGLTIHAGEAFGPASIQQAIHVCGANRIGHGTRLFEDPDLLAYVTDFRIPLEICLTSNVQTRAAPSFEQHPARRYYEAGAVVTLSTDNRLMSGTNLTEEFWLAHTRLGLDWAALCDIAVMGFQAAFLPWGEKEALIREVRGAMPRFLPGDPPIPPG